jgi:CRISPR/Cas system CSM-associated protein Csm3 (group 7 of RAMP superfamily)
MSYIPATFANRWFIAGTLTTQTPLHVGGGATVSREGLVNERTGDPVQVKAVFCDHRGRACLPGSSLRGVLRERLAALLGQAGASKREQDAIVLRLFGKPELAGADERKRKNQPGHGGRLAVHDAMVVAEPFVPPDSWHPPAFWNPHRRTGVTSSVAIDRRTRTAAPQKLFHAEFVPPDVAFAVRLTAENLDDKDIPHLLRALEEFDPNAACPLVLGADTGNGWGRLVWRLAEVRSVDSQFVRSNLEAWLREPRLVPGGVPDSCKVAPPTVARGGAFAPNALRIPLSIHFHGQFLVKETQPAKKRQTGKQRCGPQDFDALPRLDTEGRLLLPAASVRGALRSRAGRILRTLGIPVPDPSRQPERLKTGDPPETLSLVARLFGATGWKAALDFTDFVSSKPAADCSTPELAQRHAAADSAAPRLFAQDFVAIDRFSGGVAYDQMPDGTIKGRKFTSKYAWQPVLHGTVRLRLERAPPIAWGLLALTLRDLLDDDMRFGVASAKGYGDCRGESEELARWIASDQVQQAISALQATSPLVPRS